VGFEVLSRPRFGPEGSRVRIRIYFRAAPDALRMHPRQIVEIARIAVDRKMQKVFAGEVAVNDLPGRQRGFCLLRLRYVVRGRSSWGIAVKSGWLADEASSRWPPSMARVAADLRPRIEPWLTALVERKPLYLGLGKRPVESH